MRQARYRCHYRQCVQLSTPVTGAPVLLLDGEELIGAKQNRVLNTTVLIAAHSHLTIPVSCVEQGRWAYKSARFAVSNASLYASVRALKAEKVTAYLRATGKHTSDQFEIWKGVSFMAAAHEVQSPTGAMSDFYARHVDQGVAARNPPPHPACERQACERSGQHRTFEERTASDTRVRTH
jgi:ARG and Rhodanese-Phosphatase-superfamily-associated Protein domain